MDVCRVRILDLGDPAVGFPIAFIRAEGEFGVAVLNGDIVIGRAVGVDFETVGDPIVRIILFDLHQQCERQFRAPDVVRDREQLTFFIVEGVEDGAVHLEGDLRVVFAIICGQDFGVFEFFAEGDRSLVVAVSGKAGGYTERQQQDGGESDLIE
jgi:hypothetical protein